MGYQGPLQDKNGWRRLLNSIARATRKPDRAEDLMHSAFVRLEDYRRRNHVANPRGFMIRSAVNLSIDEARRARVRSEVDVDVTELIDIRTNEPLQDEVIVARQRLQRIREGLERLNPRTREIFLMHRIEGLKYREIAADLGITVSAVEKHIAKAALFLTDWAQDW